MYIHVYTYSLFFTQIHSLNVHVIADTMEFIQHTYLFLVITTCGIP